MEWKKNIYYWDQTWDGDGSLRLSSIDQDFQLENHIFFQSHYQTTNQLVYHIHSSSIRISQFYQHLKICSRSISKNVSSLTSSFSERASIWCASKPSFWHGFSFIFSSKFHSTVKGFNFDSKPRHTIGAYPANKFKLLAGNLNLQSAPFIFLSVIKLCYDLLSLLLSFEQHLVVCLMIRS